VAAAASVLLIVIGLLLWREGRDIDEQLPVTGTDAGRIHGQVVAWPVCPVEGVPECEATRKPLPAVVDVFSLARGRDTADQETLITRVTTDARGRFTVELPAGDYQLMPRAPDQPLTSRPHVVQVAAGRTTDVELVLDTGIR